MSDKNPSRDDLAGETAAHPLHADSPAKSGENPTESPAPGTTTSPTPDTASTEAPSTSDEATADTETERAPEKTGSTASPPSHRDTPDSDADSARQQADDQTTGNGTPDAQSDDATQTTPPPDPGLSDGATGSARRQGGDQKASDATPDAQNDDEDTSPPDHDLPDSETGSARQQGDDQTASNATPDAQNDDEDTSDRGLSDGATGSARRQGGDVEGGGGSGGDAAGGKRRTRRRKAVRRTAFGLVVAMLLGGAGAGWLYRDLMGGIEQKDVGDQLGENRPVKLNKSLNILLIGSDSREGDNAEYAVAGMAGARSDTAILLHLSPNRDQAVGISFPRDSMVQIPGCRKEQGGTVPGRFGMLNSAFAFAGPTCTWKTLESLTGIHIDHFVQVDFSGFKRMVDALGGVEICVDKPVNDPRAGLHLKAGEQTVKGEQALGYVRARYSLGNGSDLERIERQQKFMAAVVDKATDSVLSDPARTYKFLKAATKSITTDDELDLSAMRKLADGLRGMSAGQVRFVTVPVERYAPDPNRVQWNQGQATALFEAIRHDDELPAEPAEPVQAEQAPPAPEKVNVAVVDAGGKDPLVRRVVNQLGKRGYQVAEKVEKAAAEPESRIVYAASAEAQASALARDVPDALLTADAGGPAGGVRLVIGENGLRLSPPPVKKIGGGVKAGQDLCD